MKKHISIQPRECQCLKDLKAEFLLIFVVFIRFFAKLYKFNVTANVTSNIDNARYNCLTFCFLRDKI